MSTTRRAPAAPEAEDPRPERTAFTARVLIGLVLLVAVPTAFVVVLFVVGADRSSPTVAPLEPGQEPTVEAAPVPDSIEGFPQVGYAGLQVAVLEARVVQTPAGSGALAVVDLVARNDSDRVRRLAASSVDLVGVDGVAIDALRFDFTPRKDHLLVDPGRSGRTLAVYQLPLDAPDTLDQYRLRIGDAGRIAAELPFDGSVAPAPTPRALDGLPPFPQAREPVRVAGAMVRLTDAVSDVEAGTYRARQGFRVATLTFSITDDQTGDAAGLAERAAWRLVATDDLGSAARPTVLALRTAAQYDRLNRAATVTVIFTYPEDATDLLVLADDDGTQTPIVRFQLSDAG